MIKRIIPPALFLLIGTIACGFIFGYADQITIGYLVVVQVFAFLISLIFVLRPNRADKHLWIIYIIIFLLQNLGQIAEHLQL